MKICTRCKEIKPKSEFYKDKRRPDGLTCHCSACNRFYANKVCKEKKNKASKTWKQNNPIKCREQWLKQVYGITYEHYVNMFEQQNGCCAICKQSLILFGTKDQTHLIANVDHCHTTNKIRGLLCRKCNTAIGLLNDNVTVLRLAAEYLEKDSIDE